MRPDGWPTSVISTLHDPAWIQAFTDVPRERFVPYFFTSDSDGWHLVESPDPAWLAGIYSAEPLTTQLDGDDSKTDAARRGEPIDGVPTSSSSSPELMAPMLEALDVHDEYQVLEVGTGTGYNAALLCHRLGAECVTSIDVDTQLVRRAGHRLHGLGYAPHLEVRDGTGGYPGRAPFDRIIATVGFPRIPTAWLAQTKPGGSILCPLDLNGSGGLLARLTVEGPTRVSGHFLPTYGDFMSLRANQSRITDVMQRASQQPSESRVTELPVTTAIDSRSPFEFYMALRTGGVAVLEFLPEGDRHEEVWLVGVRGEWVCHTTDDHGNHVVSQSPGNLWDRIEIVYTEWQQLNQPGRDRFGLTVKQGVHTIWLDSPVSDHRWLLPV
jgi:methyltransferase of ATP-grasp peptide maturase system